MPSGCFSVYPTLLSKHLFFFLFAYLELHAGDGNHANMTVKTSFIVVPAEGAHQGWCIFPSP